MAKKRLALNLKSMKKLDESGFTLIEVMLAFAIFAVFVTAFIVGQGSNVASSSKFNEEIVLRDLAVLKLNEIILDPPEFRESLTLNPETKSFQDNDGYEFTLTYKKIEIPDLSKIKGQEDEDGNSENANAEVEKRLFKMVKENMEKMIWQVEVKVTNKETGYSFDVSSWLYNNKAQLNVQSF